MLDPSASYHLQLCGRPCTGGAMSGPPQPLADRVFLQAGTFTDLRDGLGFTNRNAIALPQLLLSGRWLLEAYELYESPADGQPLFRMPLAEQQLINMPRLLCLPPCAIQPAQPRQPQFNHWLLERNPCPGWVERVHLYQQPGKPFEATSVVYLDHLQQVQSAELFHLPLRHENGTIATARRTWVQFTGYRSF